MSSHNSVFAGPTYYGWVATLVVAAIFFALGLGMQNPMLMRASALALVVSILIAWRWKLSYVIFMTIVMIVTFLTLAEIIEVNTQALG